MEVRSLCCMVKKYFLLYSILLFMYDIILSIFCVLNSLKDMDVAQSALDILNEMLNAIEPHDKQVCLQKL